MKPILEFQNIYCKKGAPQPIEILHDLSFTVQPGERITIVGPSGSGKSTLLRLINGLDEAESGCILYKQQPLSHWEMVSLRREIGLVFQLPYLFPGTVRDNILFGPQLQGVVNDPDRLVSDLLERVGLPQEFAQRQANELSVGQQMRVSLARSLANQPQVLLLDEPTAALDRHSAHRIFVLIDEINRSGTTVLTVTHHLETIRQLQGRVLVLQNGRLTQEGSAEELLESLPPEIMAQPNEKPEDA